MQNGMANGFVREVKTVFFWLTSVTPRRASISCQPPPSPNPLPQQHKPAIVWSVPGLQELEHRSDEVHVVFSLNNEAEPLPFSHCRGRGQAEKEMHFERQMQIHIQQVALLKSNYTTSAYFKTVRSTLPKEAAQAPFFPRSYIWS